MKKHKEESFSGFIIQYGKLMALLFVGFMLVYSVFHYFSLLQKEQNRLDSTALTCSNYLDSVLDDISHMQYLLSTDPIIKGIAYSPASVENYDYVKALSMLEASAQSIGVVSSIYLYQKNTGLVLASNSGKLQIEDFFDKDFLQSLPPSDTAKIISHNIKDSKTITLYTTFPSTLPGNQTMLCVNFDRTKLEKMFLPLLNKTQQMRIETAEHEELMQVCKSTEAPAKNCFISQTDMQRYHLSMSIMLPKKTFYIQYIADFVKSSTTFLLLMLIVSAVIALLVRSIGRVIRPMVFQLVTLYQRKDSEKELTFDEFKQHFNHLLADRQEYYNQLDESRWLITEKVIDDLLQGNITCAAEFENFCSIMNINLPCQNFLVGCIQVYGKDQELTIEEKIFSKVFIKNSLTEIPEKDFYIQTVGESEDSLGVLVNFAQETDAQNIVDILVDKLRRVCVLWQKKPNLSFFFSMVAPVCCVEQVAQAYTQSKANQMYKYLLTDQIFVFESLAEKAENVLFSASELKRTVFAVDAGNLDFVQNDLSAQIELYKSTKTAEDFIKLKSQAIVISATLISQVYNSAQEEAWQLLLHDITRICQADNENVISVEFGHLLKHFSEYKLEHISQTVSCNQYIQRVIKFIEEEYTNDISVASIAAHLNLNAKYLSRLFRRETGETLTQYISDLRLKDALVLLQESHMSVREISEKIGFADPRSFTRLFKKNYGVNPADYRLV